jgi:hypothetical protein
MRGLVLFALAASLCPMVAVAADVNLDDMRKAVDKYKDVKVALADGYITPDNHCVSAANSGLPAELGAMGIHYINPSCWRSPRQPRGSTARAPTPTGCNPRC